MAPYSLGQGARTDKKRPTEPKVIKAPWSHPYREMAMTAALTSMNAAEMCGLP